MKPWRVARKRWRKPRRNNSVISEIYGVQRPFLIRLADTAVSTTLWVPKPRNAQISARKVCLNIVLGSRIGSGKVFWAPISIKKMEWQAELKYTFLYQRDMYSGISSSQRDIESNGRQVD